MTSKEKAEDLIKKFNEATVRWWQFSTRPMQAAKDCAILCVKEIIQQYEETFHKYGIGYMGNAVARKDITKDKTYQYWNEVLLLLIETKVI